MRQSIIEYTITEQRDNLKEYSDKFDISNFKEFLNFRHNIQDIESKTNEVIGKIVMEYYKQLENELKIEILRDSFAEKYTKIKPHQYEYSIVFNFYECTDKQDTGFGTIATKGDILAELIINIIFE